MVRTIRPHKTLQAFVHLSGHTLPEWHSTYFGPRYAQRALAPEAFDRAAHPHGARVPASLLRARLPQVSDIAARRLAREYPKECKSLAQMFTEDLTFFVEGCENAERKNGEPCLLKATY